MATMADTFRCFWVERDAKGEPRGAIVRRSRSDLPVGDVLIRVQYSSLNYKDALAATGHSGVVRQLPHIPGVDAAGIVVESRSADVAIGAEVLVTGHELGAGRFGGWSEYVQVPADWVVARPAGLSLREAMIHGTAGFTAAQCVMALEHHGILPESGEVIVTGATGGVGSLAVLLLARLGYSVVAVTGKADQHDRLRAWGATRVLSRQEVDVDPGKPLLAACWAGAVDTVGGNTLATLLRQCKHRGCVTACGLVGGANLAMTVYPFLLRGVTLCGIDSAACPREPRLEIWRRLAGPWKLENLDSLATIVSLEELPQQVARILRGEIVGRVLVNVAEPQAAAT